MSIIIIADDVAVRIIADAAATLLPLTLLSFHSAIIAACRCCCS